ncbi:hemagglutinin [Paraburkholderia aspalathi]|nr:hemagglutinin [Paraburkholderia aspalathi]
MNRIHCVIWSETRGAWVVATEFAKAGGKGATRRVTNKSNNSSNGDRRARVAEQETAGLRASRSGMLMALGLGAVLAIAIPGIANAALVSVCSGVSLPPSVLTGIIGQAVSPLATSLDGVGLLGGLNLNTNLGNTLNSIAAGNPINLNVLDTSGNVVSPGAPCNATADSYALNTAKGISIGGNQITGLGNGTTASAGEINSIAFGNGAATDPTAANSIAIGPNASVGPNASNSVALGSGAASTGTNSVALGANSSDGGRNNVVSVGAAGADRQVINVAAGTQSTDAANMGQLNGTLAGLGGGAGVDPVTGAVTAPSYTVYNPNGTTSTVNNVGAALDDINSTGIKYFHADSTAPDSQALGTDSVAIGPNAVANNAGDVALGSGSTTAPAVGTASTTINGTTYNFAGTTPTSTVSVGAPGAERTITNVAAGRVSGTSTDAVNGSQLYATNQAIGAVGTAVNGLGNSTASNLGGGSTYNPTTGTLSAPSYNVYGSPQNNVGAAVAALQNNAPVQYSTAGAPTTGLGANGTPTSNDVTLVGPVAGSPVTLHNVAAGVAPTDAVNVSQLDNATNAVASKWITGNPTTYTAPTATGTDSTAVGSGAASTGTNSVALGTNSSDGGRNNVVSVGAAGADRQVINVAAGTQSTDAANMGQLNGTLAGLGGGAGVDPVTGAVTAPSYTVYNPNGTTSTVNNVGAALDDINSTGIKYFHADSTAPDSQALGTDSVAIGPNAVANNAGDVALGSGSTTAPAVGTASTTINGTTYNFAGTTPTSTVSVGAPGAERTITNVAAGRVSGTSTDAVNGSQLNALEQALDAATNKIDNLGNSTASNLGGGSTYNPATGTVGSPTYNVGNNPASNVAGALSSSTGGGSNEYFHANSTLPDSQATGKQAIAVGGHAQASGANSVAIGANAVASGSNSNALGANATASASNSTALGAGSVADRANSVSIGSVGNERQMTNVAAGTQGTDAVNLNQLNSAVTQANGYTDQVAGQLQQSINSTARSAYSGVAAVTALAMIPEVDKDKTLSVGVGVGTYMGYQAVALGGTARITENIKVRAGVGMSAAGTTAGMGASMQW